MVLLGNLIVLIPIVLIDHAHLPFAAFWGVQLLFVNKGLAAVRQLETWR